MGAIRGRGAEKGKTQESKAVASRSGKKGGGEKETKSE